MRELQAQWRSNGEETLVAFNFKSQFADAVESGKKLQTIRRTIRAKAGDKVQLYTGMRTPDCRLLREAKCVAVDSILITPQFPYFGQPGWWPKDRDLFAQRDGFWTYSDMYAFFFKQYKNPQFEGYVYLFSAKEVENGMES